MAFNHILRMILLLCTVVTLSTLVAFENRAVSLYIFPLWVLNRKGECYHTHHKYHTQIAVF